MVKKWIDIKHCLLVNLCFKQLYGCLRQITAYGYYFFMRQTYFIIFTFINFDPHKVWLVPLFAIIR